MVQSDGMFNSLGYKCPALQAVDISGCSQLTDSGIATFLNLYPNCFKDFRAAGTSFGPASSRALLHAVPVDVASTSKNHALQTLDLDKCFGIFSTVVFCTYREIQRKFAAGFTDVCWCSCNMMYNSVFYTEKEYSHSAPFTRYVPTTYRMS
jgi:hypothetical protein